MSNLGKESSRLNERLPVWSIGRFRTADNLFDGNVWHPRMSDVVRKSCICKFHQSRRYIFLRETYLLRVSRTALLVQKRVPRTYELATTSRTQEINTPVDIVVFQHQKQV